MQTHADKNQENQSKAFANAVSQKKSSANATFQFVDNRPEAVAQRKLQEIEKNSNSQPLVVQLQRNKKVSGQDGLFDGDEAGVHIHHGIPPNDHLKLGARGKRINLNDQSDGISSQRAQDALEQLLSFKASIAKDRRHAAKEENNINDCIAFLCENGAKMPQAEQKPAAAAEAPKEKEEKKEGGYDDFFASMHEGQKTPPDDDFM